MKHRFKIDMWEGVNPFGLFYLKKVEGFLWGGHEYWYLLGSFKTREEARARHELIKDLPEYLD